MNLKSLKINKTLLVATTFLTASIALQADVTETLKAAASKAATVVTIPGRVASNLVAGTCNYVLDTRVVTYFTDKVREWTPARVGNFADAAMNYGPRQTRDKWNAFYAQPANRKVVHAVVTAAMAYTAHQVYKEIERNAHSPENVGAEFAAENPELKDLSDIYFSIKNEVAKAEVALASKSFITEDDLAKLDVLKQNLAAAKVAFQDAILNSKVFFKRFATVLHSYTPEFLLNLLSRKPATK
jgi:hypothetical protein